MPGFFIARTGQDGVKGTVSMPSRSRATLLAKFISAIPAVKKELRNWATLAQQLPEPLGTQALLSIRHKGFHCVGGSIYAHYPGADPKTMLRFIVALQTISDYLDNLADRLGVNNAGAFRLLHQSMIDALTPGAPLVNYYQLYPYNETKYLPRLVQTCQDALKQVPHYSTSRPYVLSLAHYYCELQVLKHISEGETLLRDWVEANSLSELLWNEWAAACGSTLGMFLLVAMAFEPPDGTIRCIVDTYFPWIQGLHILLDYLIDLAEDRESGDMNFVASYPSQQIRDARLRSFARESKRLAKNLPCPQFHRVVVDGLIALYGSDPKVRQQNQEPIIDNMACDGSTLRLLSLCKGLRRLNFV